MFFVVVLGLKVDGLIFVGEVVMKGVSVIVIFVNVLVDVVVFVFKVEELCCFFFLVVVWFFGV